MYAVRRKQRKYTWSRHNRSRKKRRKQQYPLENDTIAWFFGIYTTNIFVLKHRVHLHLMTILMFWAKTRESYVYIYTIAP